MIRHVLVSREGEVIGRDWCGGMLKLSDLSELSEPAQASTSGIAESKEVNQGEQIAE